MPLTDLMRANFSQAQSLVIFTSTQLKILRN
ncbi:hypothetical protein JOE11_005528 [Robbsia andropogonis]